LINLALPWCTRDAIGGEAGGVRMVHRQDFVVKRAVKEKSRARAALGRVSQAMVDLWRSAHAIA
jgi:hypothetical protein